MTTHSSGEWNGNPPPFLPGESHGQRTPASLQSMGLQRVKHNWVTNSIRDWIDIFQRRHTYGQKVHEKVLNIISHQGNANQIIMTSHLTPVRMAVIEKTTNAAKDVGKREPWCILGEWKLVQLWWKTVWKILEKIKTRTTIRSSNPTSGCKSEGNKIQNSKISAFPCSLHFVPKSHDLETTLSIHQQMNGESKYYCVCVYFIYLKYSLIWLCQVLVVDKASTVYS